MTRKDVANRIVSGSTGIPLRAAETALGIVLETIINLDLGEVLELRGVGTFERRMIAPKGKRNPITGETVEVKPYSTIKFKPSKHIRR